MKLAVRENLDAETYSFLIEVSTKDLMDNMAHELVRDLTKQTVSMEITLAVLLSVCRSLSGKYGE